jgi:transcriptional regulator with XRE-family HTH domain
MFMTPTSWIKKLRVSKEFKQATVAHRLGISQQAYSKIENAVWVAKGKLPDILQALESSPEELKKMAELFPLETHSTKTIEGGPQWEY